VQRQAASLTGSRGDADPFADRRDGGGNYTVIGARAYGRFVRVDVAQRSPLNRFVRDTLGTRLGRRSA
jgi:hypothetical protein